jgi:hypothetical protein
MLADKKSCYPENVQIVSLHSSAFLIYGAISNKASGASTNLL